ncbi:hypothetical protein QE152_g25112 [Popillia japonica]|uniref:Uncharacterized protein n=1 Tax=Popillia japonica TaxID=7064 RepID=A0AAW1K1E5_POPJA
MIARNYLLSITVFLILDVTWSKQDDAWINSQIASDPRIQQLRRFAEIHQAKSDNKQPQEVFYLVADDDPRLEYPRLTLKNVSSCIITISGDLNASGYSIYLSNAYVLLFVRGKYIYFIIRGKLSKSCPILTWLNLLLYLQNPHFALARNLSWRNTHTVFNIWNPFRSGIVGFGVDKNLNFNTACFNFIYSNQTSHIDTTNQNIVAYIHEDFLQIIAEDMPETRTDGFIAFMYFTRNNVNNSYEGVGFRIPQYCNRNGIAPLKVYFDTLSQSNWTNFGSFRIPNDNITYSTCLIEQMSYISFDISTNRYYQSHESVEYCPPTLFKIGPSYMAEFEATALDRYRLSKSLYIDHNMRLLLGYCEPNSSFTFEISSYIPINISSLTTNQTMIMYRPLVDIPYTDYSNVNLRLNSDVTYIDVYLYILNIVALNAPQERMIPILIEGMKRLQSQVKYSNQISRLIMLMELIVEIKQRNEIVSDSEKSTFVVEYINPARNIIRNEIVSDSEKSTFVVEYINPARNIIGIALSSDNSIELLTSRYPTENVILDDNIDAIVQLSHYSNQGTGFITVAIFTDKFYYEQARVSETKIICLLQDVTFINYNTQYFDVYLKILDGSNNGFWHSYRIDEESYKKYRIRATVAMPFMLGLVWIVLASVMAPDPIISLVGWYLFYFIIPSQGFVLFIFMVLLDQETRCKWLELLRIKQGFVLFIFMVLLDQETRCKWLELLRIKKMF